MVFCHDMIQLEKAWSIIDSWSSRNKIEENKAKSAVLKLRVDNRTPMPTTWNFHDIPLVKEYKYLGITFTDTLKFQMHKSTLGAKERELRATSRILGDLKLDSKARWHIYQSLFRSRVSNGMNLITAIDSEAHSWLKGFTYRSLKLLLGIK